MQELSVRPATAADIEPAAALLAQADFRGWGPRALEDKLGAPGWLLVAVGAPGAPEAVALASAVLDEAELIAVAVVPAVRRQGRGRRVLEGLCDRLRSLGVTRLHLEVRKANVPARALYDGLGFVEVGLRPRFYGDDDAVLMTRDFDRDIRR